MITPAEPRHERVHAGLTRSRTHRPKAPMPIRGCLRPSSFHADAASRAITEWPHRAVNAGLEPPGYRRTVMQSGSGQSEGRSRALPRRSSSAARPAACGGHAGRGEARRVCAPHFASMRSWRTSSTGRAGGNSARPWLGSFSRLGAARRTARCAPHRGCWRLTTSAITCRAGAARVGAASRC